MKNTSPDRSSTASAACRVLAPADSLPEWIELLPAGPVVGRDGREWINDDPQGVVDRFVAMQMHLPIDIEHSTELKGVNGDPAPAVGWIEEMAVREGAVWARVSWNDEGAKLLRERKYRYFSPVFTFGKPRHDIHQVTSVGLTNQPNLRVAALNRQQEQSEMSLSKLIAQALELADDATEQDAVTAINRLKNDHQTALNRADNPSLDKYVPRADYDAAINRASEAETRLQSLQHEQLEREIESEIDAALAAGKITPATVDYHKAQCRAEGGLERFREYVAAAPEIGGDAGIAAVAAGKQSDALTEDELAICRATGQTPDEFKALKEANK